MSVRFKIKYIFYFLLFFLLHYLEGLTFGQAFSFAQLWKIPILAALLVFCFKKRLRLAKFTKAIFLFMTETLMNRDFLITPFNSLLYASRFLPLPLFYEYFNSRTKKHAKAIQTVLYALAQYVALSSLITLMGLVEPITQWQDASEFGDGMFYYSSVFGHAHPAASYFCVSIVILLNGFKMHYFKKRSSKIFNMGLIAVCLVSIMKAYVRTGWVMLIVGVLFLFKPSRITQKTLNRFILAVFCLFMGFIYLFQTNEEFRNRLAGQQLENTDRFTMEKTGSGRMSIWKSGCKMWSESEWNEILLGVGHKKVLEHNYRETGAPVGMHSLFLECLVELGVVGLVLMLVYNWQIFKFINAPSRKKSPYRGLANAVFFGGVFFYLFQSNFYFIYAVFLALVMALHNYESQLLIHKKNETANP